MGKSKRISSEVDVSVVQEVEMNRSPSETSDNTHQNKTKRNKKQKHLEPMTGSVISEPDDNVEDTDDNPHSKMRESKKRKFKAESETSGKKFRHEESDNIVESLAKVTEEKLKERDRRTLFVRAKVLKDIEVSELMRIANGVDDIRRKGYIAYMVFESEKKAKKGYKKLQGYNLHGEELYVDYVGEKSKVTVKDKYNSPQQVDPLKLFVSGVPVETSVDDVREVFPKAQEITLPKTFKNNFKYALVSFGSVEEAQEAFGQKNVKIREKAVTVFFAKKLKGGKNSGKKRENKNWK